MEEMRNLELPKLNNEALYSSMWSSERTKLLCNKKDPVLKVTRVNGAAVMCKANCKTQDTNRNFEGLFDMERFEFPKLNQRLEKDNKALYASMWSSEWTKLLSNKKIPVLKVTNANGAIVICRVKCDNQEDTDEGFGELIDESREELLEYIENKVNPLALANKVVFREQVLIV